MEGPLPAPRLDPDSFWPVGLPTQADTAAVDDSGRLRLPKEFLAAFRALPDARLVVNSLNLKTAQVYPWALWRENLKLLAQYRDDPQRARRVAILASEYGGDVQIDRAGRIQLPQALRELLGLKSTSVRIFGFKGRLEIVPEKQWLLDVEEAKKSGADDVNALEVAGLY